MIWFVVWRVMHPRWDDTAGYSHALMEVLKKKMAAYRYMGFFHQLQQSTVGHVTMADNLATQFFSRPMQSVNPGPLPEPSEIGLFTGSPILHSNNWHV
jgi:hypothetical protein